MHEGRRDGQVVYLGMDWTYWWSLGEDLTSTGGQVLNRMREKWSVRQS